MKNRLFFAVCSATMLLSGITGWFAAPNLAMRFFPACSAESVLIYYSGDGTVVTRSRWTVSGQSSLRTAAYSAQILFYDSGNKLKNRIFSEKSLTIGAESHGGFFRVRTEEAHAIGAANPATEKWTEPFSRQGFSADIYVMRSAEGTILTGFRARPRAICRMQ